MSGHLIPQPCFFIVIAFESLDALVYVTERVDKGNVLDRLEGTTSHVDVLVPRELSLNCL